MTIDIDFTFSSYKSREIFLGASESNIDRTSLKNECGKIMDDRQNYFKKPFLLVVILIPLCFLIPIIWGGITLMFFLPMTGQWMNIFRFCGGLLVLLFTLCPLILYSIRLFILHQNLEKLKEYLDKQNYSHPKSREKTILEQKGLQIILQRDLLSTLLKYKVCLLVEQVK